MPDELSPPLDATSFTNVPALRPMAGEPNLAPLTVRAATIAAGQRGTIRYPSFRERNVDPGTEFDEFTGLGAWDRLRLATRNAEQDQLRYLEGKYPGKVRKSDTGEWIVRVNDEKTGEPRDILAVPHKITLNDFAAVAGDVPEIGEYLLGQRIGKMLPLLGKAKGLVGGLRDVVTGAGGLAIGGTAEDVMTRLGEAPIDLPEIARRRTAEFEFNVLAGGVTVPVQRFFQWTKNPFGGSRTETQFDAIEGQRYLEQQYGIHVPLTLGELTGNPDIIRREKFTGKIIGGSKTYQQFKQTAQGALEKVQNIMLGQDVPDDEKLGQDIIAGLQAKTAPVLEGAESARTGLETAAQGRIASAIEGRTLPATDLTPTQVGTVIRNRLTQLRDAAKVKADELYGAFREMTGDEPVISGKDLAKSAEAIKKEAASAFKTTHEEVIAPDTGETLFTKSATSQEMVKSAVPEGSIMKRLDDMIANKGAKYRFSDLQKIRADIYDDLAKSEAVPGLGPHYLSQMGKAVTEAMEQGVEKIGDPTAKAALEAANKHYREQVVPFSKSGINEVFRNEFESGHLGPAELANRFMPGAPAATDRFNLLKQFLGAGSNEFRLLKRSIADQLVTDATEPGGETLDAAKFLKAFSDFNSDRNTKEIAKEVFGDQAGVVMNEAKFLLRAQAEGGKFDAGDLRKLLSSGSPTVPKLRALLVAEKAKDDLLNTKLLRAVAEGTTEGLSLSPEDVVNRFINRPERNIGEVRDVLALLADRPQLTQDIRTKYLESIFRMADESGNTYAQALKRAGGDKKARLILGNKLFESLENYGMLKGGQEFPRTIAEQAGAMAGGSIMDKLLVHPLQTAKRAVREFVTAKVLTDDEILALARNINPSDPGALQLVLTSAPFIESLARNFGPTGAQNVAREITTALDDWRRGMSGAQQQQEQRRQKNDAAMRRMSQPLTADYFKTNAPANP